VNQIQLFIQSDKFKLVVSGRHLKSVPFVVLLHAFEEGPVFFSLYSPAYYACSMRHLSYWVCQTCCRFLSYPGTFIYCLFIRHSVSVLQTANGISFPCVHQLQQVNLVDQINLGAVFQGCEIIGIITSLSESL